MCRQSYCFRIVQSIGSPYKPRLLSNGFAELAEERLEEIVNPHFPHYIIQLAYLLVAFHIITLTMVVN